MLIIANESVRKETRIDDIFTRFTRDEWQRKLYGRRLLVEQQKYGRIITQLGIIASFIYISNATQEIFYFISK